MKNLNFYTTNSNLSDFHKLCLQSVGKKAEHQDQYTYEIMYVSEISNGRQDFKNAGHHIHIIENKGFLFKIKKIDSTQKQSIISYLVSDSNKGLSIIAAFDKRVQTAIKKSSANFKDQAEPAPDLFSKYVKNVFTGVISAAAAIALLPYYLYAVEASGTSISKYIFLTLVLGFTVLFISSFIPFIKTLLFQINKKKNTHRLSNLN